MSVKNKISSIQKKYFNIRHWMDVDGVTANASRVAGLFKELKQLTSSKEYDPSLTFQSWCAKNKIQDAELNAYSKRVLLFLYAYIAMFLLLFGYGVFLIFKAKYLVSLYLFILSASVFLYTFKQYIIWALLKMQKLNCSLSELCNWTFSKKK
jgi:hypothetical protein